MSNSVVQAWAGQWGGVGATNTQTYGSVPTAGNLLVCTGATENVTGTLAISDNMTDGGLWNTAVGPHSNVDTKQYIFWKQVGASANSNKTVTLTQTVGSAAISIGITEIHSTVGGTWALDGTPLGSNAATTNPNIGNITTTDSNPYIVLFDVHTNTGSTATSGYTVALSILTDQGTTIHHQLATASGNYAVATTNATVEAWVVQGAAFKNTSGAGASTTTNPGMSAARIATKGVGPMAQRASFRRQMVLDITVAMPISQAEMYRAAGTRLTGPPALRRNRIVQPYFPPASVVLNVYVLNADVGSYTLTGITAGTLKTSLLNAITGAYILTGQNTKTTKESVLSANSGSYALSGMSNSMLVGRLIKANSGAYALAGQVATLLITRLLKANTGSYALSGTTAKLLRAALLQLVAGNYTYTGTSATLTSSGVTGITMYLDLASGHLIMQLSSTLNINLNNGNLIKKIV